MPAPSRAWPGATSCTRCSRHSSSAMRSSAATARRVRSSRRSPNHEKANWATTTRSASGCPAISAVVARTPTSWRRSRTWQGACEVRLFTFQRAASLEQAVSAPPQAAFLAGGTNLVDLMKIEVLNPALVVDLSRLQLRQIEVRDGALQIGALASNTAVAEHPEVRGRAPGLSEALLSGASPQLRNAATVGGNLLQRTRCAYYRDLATRCNKREPGSGCDALEGWTRMHAILGTSDQCIASHPSDMCVALYALDATVRVRGPDGERELAVSDLHLLPGAHPEREFSLAPGSRCRSDTASSRSPS